jgi:hypothetical protein
MAQQSYTKEQTSGYLSGCFPLIILIIYAPFFFLNDLNGFGAVRTDLRTIEVIRKVVDDGYKGGMRPLHPTVKHFIIADTEKVEVDWRLYNSVGLNSDVCLIRISILWASKLGIRSKPCDVDR